jgi:hypothetical protein
VNIGEPPPEETRILQGAANVQPGLLKRGHFCDIRTVT